MTVGSIHLTPDRFRATRNTLLSTLAALLASAAWAQEPPGTSPATESPANASTTEERRETIVVTATRAETTDRRIPSNVTVIGGEEIAEGGYTSLPQALEKKAGLHFRSFSDNPSQAEVDIRGFGENSHGRVLVMVNGRKLNRPDMATVNWLQIPLRNVEKVEVIRGANTALYGDHAVGGVINVITKRGSEKPECEVSGQIGSYGYYDAGASASGRLGKLGASASVDVQSSDGYRERSAYDATSATLGLEYAATDWLTAYFDGSVTKNDYELPGAVSAEQMREDRRQAINLEDDVAEQQLYADWGLRSSFLDGTHKFDADFAFAHRDIEANTASWLTWTDQIVDTWSISPKYTLETDLGSFHEQLVAGVDWTRDELAIDRYNDLDRTLWQGQADITRDSLAPFVRNTLSYGKWASLSLGGRWGESEMTVETEDMGTPGFPPFFPGIPHMRTDDSKTHRECAYHIGATVNPIEQVKVFAKYDTIYRFPFTDEQAVYVGYGLNSFNFDLEPETGESIEAGLEAEPFNGASIQLTWFEMKMEGEIAWDGYRNVNLDDTLHTGVEIAADYRFRDIARLSVNYTWLDAEFERDYLGDPLLGVPKHDAGDRIPLVPEHKLTVAAEVNVTRALVLLGAYNYTSDMLLGGDDDNVYAPLDEYTTVDFGVRYTQKLPGDKVEIQATIGVDNVFDEEYSPMGFASSFYPDGVFYPAVGRTYRAGLSVKF